MMLAAKKEVLDAALKLRADERQELAGELWESLEAGGLDLGPEWEAEIQRRIQAVDAGEMKTTPGEEVMDRLKQRFGGR